jgi:hypothetical protein
MVLGLVHMLNFRQHNGQKKKDKQQSTKHIHKTKDRVTQTSLKTGGELRWPGRISSSCSTEKYIFFFSNNLKKNKKKHQQHV